MSIGSSFNIAQQALQNSQYALNLVSNNIANMNTAGYSKQSAEFTALNGYSCYNWCSSGNNLKLGHGAELSSISRNRDTALDNYFRDQNAQAAFYNQIGSMASTISSVMNEMQEGGLQSSFSEFFSTVAKLNGDPTNNAYRISFAEKAQDIANQFNKMASLLTDARNQTIGELGDLTSFQNSKVFLQTEQLNEKLSQLAEINGKIAQSTSRTGANASLLDQKDLLLDEISSIIPVKITQNDNGTSNLYLGNNLILQGGEQKMVFTATQGTTYDEPVIFSIEDAEGKVINSNVNDLLKTGSLAALGETNTVESKNLTYTSVLNDLNTLARAFAEAVNEIQTQKYTVDGVEYTPMSLKDGVLVPATEPIFEIPTPPDTFDAANIKVNQAILDNPNNIAAAAVAIDPNAAPPGYDAEGIGNNTNMQRFLGLQSQKLDLLDTAGTGVGMTLDSFLGSVITEIGTKVGSLNDKMDTQSTVVSQIATQRSSLFGVNLDEELADLIKYQRAYEAAARVFNVASQIMQVMTTLGQ